ncbi:MAG: PilZ domain-containing protein [Alphaproteobacteria bacterium]|nr:PilZ domain-containing protein [Alphaproteobacteria bacterium]
MATETLQRQSERRRVVRQKSFLRGMVYFNNRRSVLDCLIRDISPYGARLIFSDSVTVPDALDLYIPQKDQSLRVHVIWRHGQDLGVAFTQAEKVDSQADSGDLAERVARIEVELASLKRVMKKLKADSGPDFDAA